MNRQQVRQFFKNYKYADVEYTCKFLKDGEVEVFASGSLVDSYTGVKITLMASEVFNYRNADEISLLNAMRDWVHVTALHDADERIVYKGKRVFNPHQVKVSLY